MGKFLGIAREGNVVPLGANPTAYQWVTWGLTRKV